MLKRGGGYQLGFVPINSYSEFFTEATNWDVSQLIALRFYLGSYLMG